MVATVFIHLCFADLQRIMMHHESSTFLVELVIVNKMSVLEMYLVPCVFYFILSLVKSQINWQQIQFQNSGPTIRKSAAMMYEPKRNFIVIFGGTDSNGTVLGDTWVLDLNTGIEKICKF